MSKTTSIISKGIIYFPKYQIPKKASVMRSLGVKKRTFAGDMISRLYDYFVFGATDFSYEYRHYYSQEFNSIAEFIEERYNMERERAEQLSRNHFCMKDYSRDSIERNIETLLYDHNFQRVFFEAIGGVQSEDSDEFCD